MGYPAAIMNGFGIFILIALIVRYLLLLGADLLNRHALDRNPDPLIEDLYPAEARERTRAYLAARLRVRIVESSLGPRGSAGVLAPGRLLLSRSDQSNPALGRRRIRNLLRRCARLAARIVVPAFSSVENIQGRGSFRVQSHHGLRLSSPTFSSRLSWVHCSEFLCWRRCSGSSVAKDTGRGWRAGS